MTPQSALFPLAEPNLAKPPRFKSITRPLWTHQKANLIARYIRLFIMITKHGAYIDGFAGPQAPDEPNSWAAELALNIRPPWMRQFFLCDAHGEQVARLNMLKARQPTEIKRSVEISHGDFNVSIDRILASGAIKAKTAAFALLDQRTFECDWATVQKIARHKPEGERKIEIFYFLPTGWFDRAYSGLSNKQATLNRWWGRSNWQEYQTAKPPSRPNLMTRRFVEELGYATATPWPIRSRLDGGRLMYAMIHATDHPDAPQLMQRAYRLATAPLDQVEQLEFTYGLRDQSTQLADREF